MALVKKQQVSMKAKKTILHVRKSWLFSVSIVLALALCCESTNALTVQKTQDTPSESSQLLAHDSSTSGLDSTAPPVERRTRIGVAKCKCGGRAAVVALLSVLFLFFGLEYVAWNRVECDLTPTTPGGGDFIMNYNADRAGRNFAGEPGLLNTSRNGSNGSNLIMPKKSYSKSTLTNIWNFFTKGKNQTDSNGDAEDKKDGVVREKEDDIGFWTFVGQFFSTLGALMMLCMVLIVCSPMCCPLFFEVDF